MGKDEREGTIWIMMRVIWMSRICGKEARLLEDTVKESETTQEKQKKNNENERPDTSNRTPRPH